MPGRQLAHRIIVVVLLLPIAQGERDGPAREVIVPARGAPAFLQFGDAVERVIRTRLAAAGKSNPATLRSPHMAQP
jgi:hypothetical protein